MRKKKTDWEANQKKAELMADKFIEVLQKLDCWHSWESILTEAMIKRLKKDSGLKIGFDPDGIISALESNLSVTCVKTESLSEQIKLDEFLAEMKENPYQLSLI